MGSAEQCAYGGLDSSTPHGADGGVGGANRSTQQRGRSGVSGGAADRGAPHHYTARRVRPTVSDGDSDSASAGNGAKWDDGEWKGRGNDATACEVCTHRCRSGCKQSSGGRPEKRIG